MVVLVLTASGVLPHWPGVVQQVGLPPLDIFADIRVLVTQSPSVPVFVLGLVAAIAVRALLLAWALGFSWRRVRLALVFYLVAAVPAVVSAAFAFSARAVLYAYFFWIALALLVLTFGLSGAAPWAGSRRPFRRPFTLGGYAVVLTLLGVLARIDGRPVALLAVLLSALLTVLTADALSRPAPRWNRTRVAGGVTAFAAVVGLVAAATLAGPAAAAPVHPRQGSLVLVGGVGAGSGSAAIFSLDPAGLGFTCAQTTYFSYAGPGGGAPQGGSVCPITRGAPYTGADTLRPLDGLVSSLVTQLATLPGPITIVTHSQGAWIAWSALTREHVTGVDDLVLLGPFRQAAVGYPAKGRSGRGVVGGDLVRTIITPIRQHGTTSFDPDGPLPKLIHTETGTIPAIFARPLPAGTRTLSLVAEQDLPQILRTKAEGCPVFTTHTGLPGSPTVRAATLRFLAGEPAASCTPWSWWTGPVTEAYGIPRR